MKKYLLLLITFSICSIFFISCADRKARVYKESRILMDTVVSITVASMSKEEADKAFKTAFKEIEKIAELTDFYSPESEISIINKNAGISAVRVSSHVISILEKAIYVSEKTEGAFDITTGALSPLYDFRKKIKPAEHELSMAVKKVDYRNVVIDRNNSSVFLRKKGMLIDTGGVTKGYASDRAAELLKKQWIHSGIVAVGGEIHAFGKRPDGKHWRVGIKDPDSEGDNEGIIAALELSDASVSTSGDYQRYFVLDGKRYHHILDPKTGYPAGLCRSVTVVSDENVLTDAFATGIFVLGPEKGFQLLKDTGLEGIIIDNRNNILITPELERKLEFTGNYKKYNKSR